MFCPHCSALLPSSNSDAIVCASCDYSCTYFDIPRRYLQLQSSSEKTQDPEWLTLYKQQKKKKSTEAQQQQQKGLSDSKKSDKDDSMKKSKSKEAEKKSETKKREKEKEIESNQSKKRQRTSSESSSKSSKSATSSSSADSSSDSSSSSSSSEDEDEKIESATRKKHARAEVEETCPSCGHHRATFYTVQLRSVDEGQTVFCKFITFYFALLPKSCNLLLVHHPTSHR